MCPNALARACLLVSLVVGTQQLSITEFEVPVAKQSGEDVELRCRYDSGGETEDALIVKWWWTPVNDATAEKAQLYQRIAREPGSPIRHNIEIKDNDSIVLLEASPADSGIYECEVSLMSDKSEEVRQHQELTIFTQGSGPNLTITEVPDGPDADEEEDVFIVCKADDVAPAPDIALTVNGEEVNMTEFITGPDADGLFDIIGNTTVSKVTVDGYEVRCELFYSDSNVTHQPYVDVELYDPSGALTTTTIATLEVTTLDGPAAPGSLQNQSGDSSKSHVSFTLLLVLGFITQLLTLL